MSAPQEPASAGVVEVAGEQWADDLRALIASAEAAPADLGRDESAALAEQWLRCLWVSLTPAIIAASARASLLAGVPLLLAPSEKEQEPAIRERLRVMLAEPRNIRPAKVDERRRPRAKPQRPRPPEGWLKCSEVAERSAYTRGYLSRLVRGTELVEGEHWQWVGRRLWFHPSALEVIASLADRVKLTAAQRRQQEQEEREEMAQQESAQELEKLLGILRLNW